MCIGPFVPYSHVNQSFGVTDIFFILLFFYLFLIKKEKIRVSPIFSLVCIIPIIGFSSLFFNGIDTNYLLLGQSLGLVLKWFFFAFIIFFLPNQVEKYGPEPVIYGIFWGCFLTVLWGWYVWSLTPNYWYGFPMLHVYIDTEYTISRNFVGFYSSLGIFASIFFITIKEIPFQKKIFYLFVLILQTYTSLLTFSKGTLAAGILPVAYYLLYYRKKNIASSKSYLISNLFTTSLLFGFYALYLNFQNRLTFLGAVVMRIGTSGQSVEDRYTFLDQAIALILDNPILGVGPKMYKIAAVESGFRGTSDPHNAWLWVGGEMGLIPFFITIGLSLFCLIISFRYGYFYKNFKSIHLIVVALCIHGLVSALLISMKIFCIIMALLIGLQKFSSKEKLFLR